MTADELKDANAGLRGAIEEALKLHPKSRGGVESIAGKLDTTTGSPEQMEVLRRVQDSLRKQAQDLIRRHHDDPRVKALFEGKL